MYKRKELGPMAKLHNGPDNKSIGGGNNNISKEDMSNLFKKVITPSINVAGQSLATDQGGMVTKSSYKGVKEGDMVFGMDKFKSGSAKGMNIDKDYTLREVKAASSAPYGRPPSKYAGDFKVFQALERTNVSMPKKGPQATNPDAKSDKKEKAKSYQANYKGEEGVNGGHRVEIIDKKGKKSYATEMNNVIYVNGVPVSKKEIKKAGQTVTRV